MIVLFTDFGLAGPYVGQMKTVLAREAPGVPVIDLFADAPAFDPMLSAYLLAGYAPWFPAGTVFIAVVDPGVGTPRPPVVVEAGGALFVGPGNGLFEPLHRRMQTRAWKIAWSPPTLSASFHGRDLFAPIAARLAVEGVAPLEKAGGVTPLELTEARRPDWPDELDRIVYVDHYGNAMTGHRGSTLSTELCVVLPDGTRVHHASTFGEVPVGAALWYVNSNGLAEIAVNQGRASECLGLAPGTAIQFIHETFSGSEPKK